MDGRSYCTVGQGPKNKKRVRPGREEPSWELGLRDRTLSGVGNWPMRADQSQVQGG